MKCSDVQEKLAEGRLSGMEDEFLEHIESCGECREFYRNIRELDLLSRELRSRYKAPRDFHEKVLLDLRERNSEGWFSSRSVLLSLCLVSCLAGGFLTWDNLGNNGAVTAEILGADRPSGLEQGQVDSGIAPAVSEQGAFVEVNISPEEEEDLILRLPSVIEIHRTGIPDETSHYHEVSY